MPVDEGEQGGVLGFAVVANVVDETAHGPGGLDLRRGLRHFAAGAKVWVLPVQWGDGGEKVIVIGRHRGTGGRGYARIVTGRRHLAGFRVAAIYSPALMRAITQPFMGSGDGPALWASRDDAETMAAYWRDHPVEARRDDGWFLPNVSDPPPLEVEHDGRTYYLARFNAYQAVYSAQPPPAEPAASSPP